MPTIQTKYRVLATKDGTGEVRAFDFTDEAAATKSEGRLKAAGFATKTLTPGSWAK